MKLSYCRFTCSWKWRILNTIVLPGSIFSWTFKATKASSNKVRMGGVAFAIPLCTSFKARSVVLDDLDKSYNNSWFTLGTQRFGQFSGVWYLASKSFIFDWIIFFVQASLTQAASFSEILGPQTSESPKTDGKNSSSCPWCRVRSSTMSAGSYSHDLLSARGTEASSVLAFCMCLALKLRVFAFPRLRGTELSFLQLKRQDGLSVCQYRFPLCHPCSLWAMSPYSLANYPWRRSFRGM